MSNAIAWLAICIGKRQNPTQFSKSIYLPDPPFITHISLCGFKRDVLMCDPIYFLEPFKPFLALKTAWILPSQFDWIFSRSQMVIKCFNLSKSIRYLASISASDWSTTPKSFKTEALSSLLCLKKAGMQSVRLSCNARIILPRVSWPEVN